MCNKVTGCRTEEDCKLNSSRMSQSDQRKYLDSIKSKQLHQQLAQQRSSKSRVKSLELEPRYKS
jgi:hypothetical protein